MLMLGGEGGCSSVRDAPPAQGSTKMHTLMTAMMIQPLLCMPHRVHL